VSLSPTATLVVSFLHNQRMQLVDLPVPLCKTHATSELFAYGPCSRIHLGFGAAGDSAHRPRVVSPAYWNRFVEVRFWR